MMFPLITYNNSMQNIQIDNNLFEHWFDSLSVRKEKRKEYINVAKSFAQWVQNNNELKVVKIDEDLFKMWVSELDVKGESKKTYAKSVRLFVDWLQENNITQPTRKDIITYKDELKKSLRPTTVNTYITSIRLFFSWLAQKKYYENIAEDIKGAKISIAHKKDYLTAKEIKLILDSINPHNLANMRDYAIIALMSTCGLRTIEINRFNVEDLRKIKGNPVLYTQRKGKDEKADYVKLTPPVYNSIKEYLDMRMEFKKYKNCDALFASLSNNNVNGHMSTNSISGAVKNWLVNAGFDSPRITAHSLRHSAATINLEEGGTIEDTQMLLGHTRSDVTAIYDHLNRREKNLSEERISNAIFYDKNN